MPVTRIPWFAWTAVASVYATLGGIYWDISWHMSIGRDSFWTPAHLLIQLGGVLAGVVGTHLILTTTFRANAPLRPVAVRVLGFRGPLGAFVAVWGCATMIVSAPFDDWWHGAYGLDVKILSPPHTVLTLGIFAVVLGGVITVLAVKNRAAGELQRRLDRIVLALGGGALVLAMIAILEHTFRVNLHRSDGYRAIAIVAPVVLLALSRTSNRRWAATTIAGAYTLFMATGVWLMPLFPAEAKLGPVYQPITHFVPLEFPPLVIAPALALDLVRDYLAILKRPVQAVFLGLVFVATLVAAAWPFASLLNTRILPRVFGQEELAYFIHPDTYDARFEFVPEGAGGFWPGMAWALGYAIVGAWVGLVAGDALRKVRR
jgi:hypothetical protein